MTQELIGFIGAALLAICALPQAAQSYKQGHSQGINDTFLWCWFCGEMLMLSYVLRYVDGYGPLFWNYLINTILLGIIVYYKYFPRSSK